MTAEHNSNPKDSPFHKHFNPIVRGSDAMPVGSGIRHRQYVPPSLKPEAPSDPDLTSALPEKPDEWSDRPSIVGQLQDQRLWKLDRVEVKIFDFSDPKQLSDYNALVTQCSLPETNCFITLNDRQFCAQTGMWKAMVELQYVKYRKLLKKDE
jgi:hypothetical protein